MRHNLDWKHGQQTGDGSERPFPPAVQVGPFVFVSGQAATDDTGRIVPGNFVEQMDQAMNNVALVLRHANLSLVDVVQVRAYVQRVADLAEYNRRYLDYFASPRPARTTLTGCLTDQVKFEIDVIAFDARRAGSLCAPDPF
jgi:2-iminobutanoate/2-iminopropanoate deaminase